MITNHTSYIQIRTTLFVTTYFYRVYPAKINKHRKNISSPYEVKKILTALFFKVMKKCFVNTKKIVSKKNVKNYEKSV